MKNFIRFLDAEFHAVFEKNILSVKDYCDEIASFIKTNLVLELAKDIDQLQNFENNFIERNVDGELDKKTDTLKESELKLEAIREYLSLTIENREKKGKTTDYVKVHETEKNNFSLICTSRRCKILSDALPVTTSIVKLKYIN